jgi:hypothetical protein
LAVRRLVPLAAALGLAVAVGASQAGTFLPKPLREDAGLPAYVPKSGFRLRPYVQYFSTTWTYGHCNLVIPPGRGTGDEPHLYETAYEDGRQVGKPEVVNNAVGLFERHAWDSLRLYGFLPLGLAMIARRLRTGADGDPDRERLRGWFWIALFSFLAGYAVAFGLELDHGKWWLTRFLIPGIVTCLTGLVVAVAPPAGQPASWAKRLGWAALVIAATWGPMFEFSVAFGRGFGRAKIDPLTHRLNLLAHTTGPFAEPPRPG